MKNINPNAVITVIATLVFSIVFSLFALADADGATAETTAAPSVLAPEVKPEITTIKTIKELEEAEKAVKEAAAKEAAKAK